MLKYLAGLREVGTSGWHVDTEDMLVYSPTSTGNKNIAGLRGLRGWKWTPIFYCYVNSCAEMGADSTSVTVLWNAYFIL
jgi:hypothetical protein